MIKYFVALVISLCQICAFAYESLPTDRRQLEVEVHRLWLSGSFPELDAMETQLRERQTLSASGWPLLDMFYQALEQEVTPSMLQDKKIFSLLMKSTGWKNEFPKSQLAQFATANAFVARAWAARGEGYANSVSAEQWAQFNHLMKEASDYLVKNKTTLASNPYWYTALLRIAQQTSWPESSYRKLLEEALSRHPDHPNFFLDPINHYTPKWGGSAEAMVEFINSSASKIEAGKGDEMYARQYSYAIENNLFPELAQARYECRRWMHGYDRITAQFPTTFNYNHAALAAVICRDKNRAKQFFDKIGRDSPDVNIWVQVLGASAEFDKQRAWSRSM